MSFLRLSVLFAFVCIVAAATLASATGVPVALDPYVNNRGFGSAPNDADFDGQGNSYPLAYAPDQSVDYRGIHFGLLTGRSPGNESKNDNILCAGQTMVLPQGKYFSIHTLSAATEGDATNPINVTYADNSTASLPVRISQWSYPGRPSKGAFTFPYFFTNTTIQWNYTMLFETENRLDSSKEIVSLTLPSDGNPLHIFAISLVPAAAGEHAALGVQDARFTTKWFEGTEQVQIVEVTVNNIGTSWIKGAGGAVNVTIEADAADTVVPAVITRLRPGDQARVQVGVQNSPGVPKGTIGTAMVRLVGQGVNVTAQVNGTFGIPEYSATLESVLQHETPPWFDDAKFGIFIHWGLYSVPAWGNSGSNESYAEWYWYDMNLGPDTTDRTYEYHLATYGPEFVYDDFIQNFTVEAYNPREWVDLFDAAGARYFVSVSKHHDGYALYDLPANVSQRTSVAMNPQRNLLKELFDAAEEYQPHLHRTTYYSLSEWFNPAWKPYGWSKWPGGNATNPFTNQTLPYTGYVPVGDYLTDIMLPEMNALADMGTEMVWCDAGAANVTVEFMSAWFNAAAKDNRQVTFNDRCGTPADFDTPEYATYGATTPQKWESNLGMDPFSYGYNRATPAAAYMDAATLVTSLVDIVSKNGNLLLDIGPTGNGSLVPAEVRTLREAGAWIKAHGEAIYNTTYWFVTAQEGADVRFTTTVDAFFIHVLARPNGTVVLESPVPWVEGDNVTVVGGSMAGAVVGSSLGTAGELVLDVPAEVADADEFAWVFKITF